MNTKKIISCLLAIFALVSSLSLSSCEHEHKFGENKQTDPKCLSEGLIYKLCEVCGYLECIETIQPLGHKFTEWKDDVRELKKVSYCDLCGIKSESDNFEEPMNIPKLYIYGTPENLQVYVSCRYATTIDSIFSGILYLNSKALNNYHKQTYDITFYENDNYEKTLDVVFAESLGRNTNYTLKAEYTDKTLSRDTAASELWYETVKSRKNVPLQLKRLPLYGASGGFPIILYTNDNFNGIYNLSLANDNTLFGLKDDKSILIYTYKCGTGEAFAFKNDTNEYLPATVLYPEKEEAAEIAKNKFTEFMNFVNDCSDTDFRGNISKYLDVDAAIDYLLCVYMFGADDNAIESCNWVSFDGKVFIPSMYNLTRSFGMDNTGYFVAPQNTLRPFMKNDILHSGTNSILWEKLCATFSDEISQRYAYLRANVLTVEKVKNVFENKISKIPAEIYEAEFTHFPDKKLMNCPETAETISKWFGSKCDILDNIFLK